MTELVHAIRPAAGEPEGALVLMHGRGADEHDLAPFLDLLDPKRRLVGVTPGGPLFLPPGGRHWYVVPRVGFPDPDTFRASYELLQRDVPELTGVGGPTPAGIVAMSGFIPTVEGWSAELDRPGLPVWIAHGRRDPVISVEFGEAARDALTAAGADVTYREHDGAHHVDPRALAELPAWVERAIDAATPAAS